MPGHPDPATEPPLFSIVIGRAGVEDRRRILEALAALAAQADAPAHEVVVVDRLGDEVTEAIRARFPEVVLERADRRATLPELRALALGRARGRYVIVTEDHCLAPRDWLRSWQAALRAHPEAAAIAGCVENGCAGRALDWATYLCEYATLAPPLAEGRAASLAGMNTLYPRPVLDACPPALLRAGFWETTLHPRLAARGEALVATDRVRIVHCKRFSLRHFAAQRLAYSRHYAGTRFPRDRAAARAAALLAALATPLLPLLLLARLARTVAGKPGLAGPALRALPLLVLFYAVWAWGEAVGYLAGPGDALREIE